MRFSFQCEIMVWIEVICNLSLMYILFLYLFCCPLQHQAHLEIDAILILIILFYVDILSIFVYLIEICQFSVDILDSWTLNLMS